MSLNVSINELFSRKFKFKLNNIILNFIENIDTCLIREQVFKEAMYRLFLSSDILTIFSTTVLQLSCTVALENFMSFFTLISGL
jgi:hypothetical protein